MDIEKAREEIEKLESAINNLIWNFEKQTDLTVERIELRTVKHISGGRVRSLDHIVDVEVNLK